jgi:hypothetical protein
MKGILVVGGITKNSIESCIDKKQNNIERITITRWLLGILLKSLPSARAFNRRFYGAMSGVSKHYHFIRVSRGMKEDIQVWLSFLDKLMVVIYSPMKFG